ncbi:hypothetical protein [Arenibaculum sp.]|jgi:hypothetical protein|uniref:hypothetical protein n=1 Tax=Arenibaculum sp. TaxID=2865862 RepID=UPI002E10D4EA|nr:hypothetical protein [Arenibaculum sp.]
MAQLFRALFAENALLSAYIRDMSNIGGQFLLKAYGDSRMLGATAIKNPNWRVE